VITCVCSIQSDKACRSTFETGAGLPQNGGGPCTLSTNEWPPPLQQHLNHLWGSKCRNLQFLLSLAGVTGRVHAHIARGARAPAHLEQ
jgi:hypothetical protein